MPATRAWRRSLRVNFGLLTSLACGPQSVLRGVRGQAIQHSPAARVLRGENGFAAMTQRAGCGVVRKDDAAHDIGLRDACAHHADRPGDARGLTRLASSSKVRTHAMHHAFRAHPYPSLNHRRPQMFTRTMHRRLLSAANS